jgi:hypothetical protein
LLDWTDELTETHVVRDFHWDGFLYRGILNEIITEGDLYMDGMLMRPSIADDRLPFLQLFLLPFLAFSNPICTPVSPKVEVDIKGLGDDVSEGRDFETHTFGGHREAKVSILQKGDMEPRRAPSQACMQSHANRIFREVKSIPPEDCNQMKSTFWRGRGMVN